MIPIADLHCDTAMSLLAGRSLDDVSLHVNLPALRRGGIGLQVFACYIPPAIPSGEAFPLAQRMLDIVEEAVEKHRGELAVCVRSADIEAARRAGKTAVILAVENGNAIENDLGKLERLKERGVRLMTLVHSRSNDWIVSSNDPSPRFSGLSELGRDVIAAMNDLGMIIDVSHAHDRAVERVLALSRGPVVASHSCVHALNPVPRNLRDDLIRGIAESGGLIGINLYPYFLDPGYKETAEQRAGDLFKALDGEEEQSGNNPIGLAEAFSRFVTRFGRTMADERLPLDRYLDHILYIERLAGNQAVAFGTDFDGVPSLPNGVEDCSGLALVRDALAERGLSEERLMNICWSNVLRVFSSVCG
jgi:membrane dipeptidase